jgi:hypothetical protein
MDSAGCPAAYTAVGQCGDALRRCANGALLWARIGRGYPPTALSPGYSRTQPRRPRTWCRRSRALMCLVSEGRPRQDSNLRSRLRRPGAFVYCGVSDPLPGRSPGHLCLQWPRCRVVESTIDSMSYDSLDFPRPMQSWLPHESLGGLSHPASLRPAPNTTRDSAQYWLYSVEYWAAQTYYDDPR